jgi:putative oxidoreductase
MARRDERRDIEATRDVNDRPVVYEHNVPPIHDMEQEPRHFSEPPTTGESWRDRWAARRTARVQERRERASERIAVEEARREEVRAAREARRADLEAARQARAERAAQQQFHREELRAERGARHAARVRERQERRADRVERAMERRSRRLEYAPLPLRLMLGAGFIFHGWPKLFTESGHQGFTDTLAQLGVPYPEMAAWGIGGFEVIGGALLIVGALVGLVALIGIFEMLGAIFLVHLPHGFSAMNGGYEVPLLYLAGFLTLLITGAGALSVSRAIGVDAWRRRRRRRYVTHHDVTHHDPAPTPAY